MNNIASMVMDYNTGDFTISMLAKKYGISVGKTYYTLRDSGCKFIRKRRKPVSAQERANKSAGKKGIKFTPEHREHISMSRLSKYNGMNGYGHTKPLRNGYVIAYAPKHPYAHNDGYVLLHRILMEQNLGRYLDSSEVVHHINHNRSDNRIENLKLMSRHEHQSMHMKERCEKRRNDLSIKSF